MLNFTHIVHTDYSRNVGKNFDWWVYRLKILENFTIQSLKNQVNKNFYFAVFLRKCFPAVLIPELERILRDSGLKTLIMFYDRPTDIHEKITSAFPRTDFIYDTRIDSDDLFHKDAIQEIQSYEPKLRRALIYQSGYCYNALENKMRKHLMVCPPFHTVMYPYESFLSVEKMSEYKNTTKGHDQVVSALDSIILSSGKYIVLFHDNNNRSRYTEPERVGFERIETEKINEILKGFGINSNTFKDKIYA
jgi:hypothetical protein